MAPKLFWWPIWKHTYNTPPETSIQLMAEILHHLSPCIIQGSLEERHVEGRIKAHATCCWKNWRNFTPNRASFGLVSYDLDLLCWWFCTDRTMGFITIKANHWENMFGTFSKHRRIANPSCRSQYSGHFLWSININQIHVKVKTWPLYLKKRQPPLVDPFI